MFRDSIQSPPQSTRAQIDMTLKHSSKQTSKLGGRSQSNAKRLLLKRNTHETAASLCSSLNVNPFADAINGDSPTAKGDTLPVNRLKTKKQSFILASGTAFGTPHANSRNSLWTKGAVAAGTENESVMSGNNANL